ncbi:agmatinase [Rhizopus microsporus var. microsporus]|uniref:Arginase/deacetylase n=2 Tax=Rhizopus microsporus TaxID=58291 RepID=A0A2G4SFS4_RHIZD|nr:Arginase/deacetylase [Rhizopus microsporus ATCC 52813]ORE10815.1 agmatinase [Rhizopus microsporus var. microsporus]PHZ07618.1 Arginase/deacetylase [Rhizopus microsporus ATCC 52813]
MASGCLGQLGQVPLNAHEIFASRPTLERDVYVPSFAGISTFAHLPHVSCWEEGSNEDYDIAIVGAPYDIGVTFRTGARFGPSGIREGSKRIKGYNNELHVHPFQSWAKAVDCGDIPFEPFDSEHAISQIEAYTKYVLTRPPNMRTPIPRLVTLGGDHTILLPVLRAMRQVHGRPIAVIHFDSHLDTWAPEIYNVKARQSKFNHGNPLYHAAKEGLTTNGTSMHVGIRSTLYDKDDIARDQALGFQMIKANDIFTLGVEGIVERMKQILGNDKEMPVYVSIDIDVVDPSMAPATGTPETGGFLTREMKYILRGLSGYNIIGLDIVEVSPAYDTQAQLTTFLAADLIYEVMSMMVQYGES